MDSVALLSATDLSPRTPFKRKERVKRRIAAAYPLKGGPIMSYEHVLLKQAAFAALAIAALTIAWKAKSCML